MKLTIVIRSLNALFILVLCGVITAAYTVQFTMHEIPCPLCMLQRLGMIAVACCLLLNLRYGVKPFHYGLALLGAIFGGAVAIRQICLHICPGFPTFGTPVLGLGLYTWSFIVFCSSTLALGLLLLLYREDQSNLLKMNIFEKISGGFLLFIAISNVLTTLHECGITFCAK